MNWKTKEKKELLRAILALENPAEARSFLRDLMTESEIDEFARRLKAAVMLLEKVPYTEIEEKTGLSSTTVARVSKWLNTGEGGYKQVIAKLHHHNNALVQRGLS